MFYRTQVYVIRLNFIDNLFQRLRLGLSYPHYSFVVNILVHIKEFVYT